MNFWPLNSTTSRIPAQALHGLVSLLESYDLTAMEQHEIMESIVASSSNIVNLVQTITETFAKQNFDDKYDLEMSSTAGCNILCC